MQCFMLIRIQSFLKAKDIPSKFIIIKRERERERERSEGKRDGNNTSLYEEVNTIQQ